MRFTAKRYEQIFAQMVARVVARSELSDVSDSSVWKHILAAAARQDDEQYYQMTLLLKLFSIDEATDDDLDQRAREIQPGVVSRIQATKATGSVVFSRNGTVGSVVIPVGTAVKAGNQTFRTTQVGSITSTSPQQISGHGVGRDSGLVPVIADTAGLAGNVAASTINGFATKPNGVDQVTNPVALQNGLDKESNDSFRNRIKRYVASLSRCPLSAIEGNLIGQTDPTTGATILFAKVIEDWVNRGLVTVYIDDGTGTAESIVDDVTPIVATLTWNGTTTITATDTTEIAAGDWIRLNANGKWFEVDYVVANTSINILNPGAESIPSGSTPSAKIIDVLTFGFSPGNVAVGGETVLALDDYPIKGDLPVWLASNIRGNLTNGVDYTINYASGQILCDPALVAGEKIVASYVYYTGLIRFAQKIVDGDPADRANYPGLRAAGVLATVRTPVVFLQSVEAIITVQDGYEYYSVIANARQAVKDYINNLNISGDVLRSQLIAKIIGVTGVANVDVIVPANDVILLDDQLARIQDSNITLS